VVGVSRSDYLCWFLSFFDSVFCLRTLGRIGDVFSVICLDFADACVSHQNMISLVGPECVHTDPARRISLLTSSSLTVSGIAT